MDTVVNAVVLSTTCVRTVLTVVDLTGDAASTTLHAVEAALTATELALRASQLRKH